MKNLHFCLQWPGIFGVVLSATRLAYAATNTLPASAAAPTGSATERGFIVRTVQAPEAVEVANSFIRAIKQLNGTLRDASGALVPNEAAPGANADGTHNADVINFEKDALLMDVTDTDGNVLASFTPELFPGIPGNGGHTTRFAVEVVGFLELAAGDQLMAVSVGTDRTDVNDDDSYQVLVGENPRDFFAAKVGEFERFAPPFRNDTHNENQFTISVPTAGVYPFRLVYWQTGLGANLQWYSIQASTGERILINDPNDPRAIKSFRKSNVARANSPYVAEVSPLPGSAANNAAAPIQAVLLDGAAVLNDGSVKLALNGTLVVPQTRERTGKQLFLQYDPNATRTDPNNQVRLAFSDASAATYTNEWLFTINVVGGSTTKVTGQWDFDRGDLTATVGKALQYLDGPAGLTKAGTVFGTTSDLGVAQINGQEARIMVVPGDLDPNIGYIMEHGIAPNGGGTRVNQYTLVMDVMVGTAGPGAASILQISSSNNSDDGDLFWQGSNFGQGTGGYNGTGAFTPGEWHRMVAAYDMAAEPPVVVKYVDGIFQDNWTANQGLDNARRALQPIAVLFADGDKDERREWWVNSVQIRAGRLSNAEIESLGGASADGIPIALPPPASLPAIQISRSGNDVIISWPADAAGFTLESTPTLTNPTWTSVAGVTNNSATITITGDAQFFRLKK